MQPIRPDQRIAALDVIRGAAVLGILVMNIPGFALPAGSGFTAVRGGGADLAVWYVQDTVFDGRMRGLFSMLFGAGAVLFVRRVAARSEGLTAADLYYRRLLWLLAFGLVHAWVLLWPGDILYGYALSGLFLFPLRNLAPRKLALAGLLLLSVAVPQSLFEHARDTGRWREAEAALAKQAAGAEPSASEAGALEWRERREKTWNRSPEKVAAELETRHAGYASIWVDAAEDNLERQSVDYYKTGFFDQLGMMLIGMALFLSGFFEGRWRRGSYALLLLLGYGVALPLSALSSWLWVASGAPIDAFGQDLAYSASYHYVRLAVALAHASALVLIVRAGRLRRATGPLAAAGRMALTHYVAQTVICGLLLFGPVGDLFGRFSRAELMLVVLAVWTVQLLVSGPWLRRFQYGPLEWAWRSLTYGERQPMRRRAASVRRAATSPG